MSQAPDDTAARSVKIDVEDVVARLGQRVAELTVQLAVAESTRDAALKSAEQGPGTPPE